jgi:cytochrome c553
MVFTNKIQLGGSIAACLIALGNCVTSLAADAASVARPGSLSQERLNAAEQDSTDYDWKGFSPNPRIGDQSTAYLALTFRQFRSGSRANSPGMSDIARALDEGDIDAVSAYLNAAQ